MENADSAPQGYPTKKCPHCQKDIDAKAKRCPFCQADLRSWPRRHPIITALLVVVVLGIGLSRVGSTTAPSPSPQSGTPTDTVNADMQQNDPTIEQISTFPTNYIGQTFTLYVYAQDTRYYNYGFSDENSWYSLQIWDNSVSGSFDGVYAYIPKTTANQALVNEALNSPVFIKVQATIPASMWEQDSNAFLEITSWSNQ